MGAMQMADKIQFRRDTSANWTSVNPILSQGELGLETDTGKYKIGNGSTAWNSLSYGALSGAVGALDLTPTTDPSPPASNLTLYSKEIGGRIMPKWIGPAGVDTPIQPFIGMNKIGLWSAVGNSNAVPPIFGYGALTIVGTATARNVANTNLFSRMRRLGIVSAATGGSLASFRQAAAQVYIGDGGGYQGFFKVCRFGISDAATVSGARMFVGISSSVAAPTNVEPSTLTNCIGIGHRAADTNLHLFYGGSSAQTPINLGANFPTNTLSVDMYELILFSPPNQNGVVKYRVLRLNTGHVAEGTLPTSNGVVLPATTTVLSYMWGYRTNNATALAVGIDLVSDYIETDY
jgi:hypothetical protein